MARAPGFFDFDERLNRLSDLGDQLEAFAKAVTSRSSDRNWKQHWPTLTARKADVLRSIR
jgi:hypothetical protein